GYLKELVYTNNPETTEHSKRNIRREIDEIQPFMLQKIIENFTKQVVTCKNSRGGHLQDVI
ncbi:hypothetical protein EAI_05921, partial [Harpegnathos saltator]